MTSSRQSDTHRVVIDFDDGVYAKLMCPESGCEPGKYCHCGHVYGDTETEPCYDCRDEKGPECWIKSWFDNLTADELLRGSIEVPIRAEWDGDHMVAHIEPEAEV